MPNPRDIHVILEISQEEKPSFFPGVPRLYVAVNEFPDVLKFDLKSIKACVSGAAPLPAAVAEEFERVTDGGQLVEGYGLTECSPVTHVNPFNGVRKPGLDRPAGPRHRRADHVDRRSGQGDAAGRARRALHPGARR